MNFFSRLVHLPESEQQNLDDPSIITQRRKILHKNRFLRKIYKDWYGAIMRELPEDVSPVLEIGSGAGFLAEFIPRLITSEIFYCEHVNAIVDAQQLPFADDALGSVVMTDVLHHLPQVRKFLTHVIRCIRTGGKIIMIEPWVTGWSNVIYSRFHHEPFVPQAATWEFNSTGPLTGANGALPWILFVRDRAKLESEFPQLHIEKIEVRNSLTYLLSGGFSYRCPFPAFTFPFWRGMEALFDRQCGMFALIVLRKTA